MNKITNFYLQSLILSLDLADLLLHVLSAGSLLPAGHLQLELQLSDLLVLVGQLLPELL